MKCNLLLFVRQFGMNFRHKTPIEPEATITDIPIHTPSPPIRHRNRTSIITATKVGIAPKNRPEMPSITDRVSKTTPGKKVHGLSMSTMPIPPITDPMIILASKVRLPSYLIQKLSYNMLNDSKTAVLSNKPENKSLNILESSY